MSVVSTGLIRANAYCETLNKHGLYFLTETYHTIPDMNKKMVIYVLALNKVDLTFEWAMDWAKTFRTLYTEIT